MSVLTLAELGLSYATVLLVICSHSLAEEECGPGYYCTWNGAYGCAKLPMGHDNPMVCCTAGESHDGCVKAGGGTALPYCPGGGATGQGCSRYSNQGAPIANSSQTQNALLEECGDGYTCYINGPAYGCAALPLTQNSTIVCCSAGQPEEICKEASKTGTPIPYCPAGGATGGGCIRSSLEQAPTERRPAVSFEEECGDGYTCVATIAYGCAKLPVEKNFTMVCCSQGQPVKYCAKSSTTDKPLPYCPAGGATGTGCLRFPKQSRGVDSSRARHLEDSEEKRSITIY